VSIERQENGQSTILIFDFVIVPICVLFSVFDFIRSMIHFPELRLILIYSYTECKGRDLQRWIRPQTAHFPVFLLAQTYPREMMRQATAFHV
jgi:hypothetical protein